ncbi:BA75_03831T0 [Komagataella pastoris]|uniref:SAGA complex subunit Spt7 n=1 Tax=Komagataella pastoris TaxID=4922 RepID=A0A1B2JE03_PICPA|nr:BA75_03831T0 [Komagataella pastoris]
MANERALQYFVTSDNQRLYDLAVKLFSLGFFNCYFTPQQFQLLSVILENGKLRIEEDGLVSTVWDEFIKGRLVLQFNKGDGEKEGTKHTVDNVKGVENKDDIELSKENGHSPDSSSADHDITDSDNVGREETLDDQFSELYLKDGVSTSQFMCAKLRYLLFEQAIDYLYTNSSMSDAEEFNLLQDVDDMNEEKEETPKATTPQNVREIDNDYDDDEDEDEDENDQEMKDASRKDPLKTEDNEPSSESQPTSNVFISVHTDESSLSKSLVLNLLTSTVTSKPEYPVEQLKGSEVIGTSHPLLGTASAIESKLEKRNEARLIKNFSKIYHQFDKDERNFLKRRKLEISNKQFLDQDNNDPKDRSSSNSASDEESNLNNSEKTSQPSSVNKLMQLGGAANLSLKHLLSKVEENREKLNLSDLDLRSLIMDVRKNRSKWASDDKIGQEELYEACEKVVLELRGYTEHSTAFLNRVSKREAPNYYQIIKKPMDLNTVMKKLKSFQYKSKQEFVDDLMLIWKNCLTYNSDPSHFIRVHAVAMQKKTLSLIPLIPEIVIRDRSELEKDEVENVVETPQSSSIGTPMTTRVAGGKGPKKGRTHREPPTRPETPDGVPGEDSSQVSKAEQDSPAKVLDATEDDSSKEKEKDMSNVPTQEQKNEKTEKDDDYQEGAEDEEEDEDDNTNLEEDSTEDEDDLEVQTWNSLTSNARYKICEKRRNLFKENKIQPNEEAIYRDTYQMENFMHYLGDDVRIVLNTPMSRYQYYDGNEDPYLIEYDISGGIPGLKYSGVSPDEGDLEDNMLVDQLMRGESSIGESGFARKPTGMNKKFNEIIHLMQQIRRICFKISLIRQMQTQQFLHHTQMKPPDINEIQDIDVDQLSNLPNRDKLDSDVSYNSLKRSISKILMANGFESTAPFCSDVITQIAENYFGNLVKTLKNHIESKSINKVMGDAKFQKVSNKDILLLSLLENGVESPDALYEYYNENIVKQISKLEGLKSRLSSFLAELLRPGLQDLNERQFNDNSDEFLTGNFSSEIGDDFFGFRELGLEKEFGLLTSTVPLHLLHSRLNSSIFNSNHEVSQLKFDDIQGEEKEQLYKREIPQHIKLIQPFLYNIAEKSKTIHYKQLKKLNELQKMPENDDDILLIEDEDLPLKQRNTRPRVPPTGKIPNVKKKAVNGAYFLDPAIFSANNQVKVEGDT